MTKSGLGKPRRTDRPPGHTATAAHLRIVSGSLCPGKVESGRSSRDCLANKVNRKRSLSGPLQNRCASRRSKWQGLDIFFPPIVQIPQPPHPAEGLPSLGLPSAPKSGQTHRDLPISSDLISSCESLKPLRALCLHGDGDSPCLVDAGPVKWPLRPAGSDKAHSTCDETEVPEATSQGRGGSRAGS